MKEITD